MPSIFDVCLGKWEVRAFVDYIENESDSFRKWILLRNVVLNANASTDKE